MAQDNGKTDETKTPIETEDRSFQDGLQAAAPENPEEDWGDAIEDAAFGQNHALRGRPLAEDREHGSKTRKANKDEFSRRA